MNLQILARDLDTGTDTLITDEVGLLYDMATNSMNWGSGFLDTQEVAQVRRVQVICGYSHVDFHADVCKNCGHPYDRHSISQPGCFFHPPERRGQLGFGNPPSDCDCPGYIWVGAA